MIIKDVLSSYGFKKKAKITNVWVNSQDSWLEIYKVAENTYVIRAGEGELTEFHECNTAEEMENILENLYAEYDW